MPAPIGPPASSLISARPAVLIVGDRQMPIDEWPLARRVEERRSVEARQLNAELLVIEPKKWSGASRAALILLTVLGGALPGVLASALPPEIAARIDFASLTLRPASFVPEFSEAMVKLNKGEMTQTPVKSQFGYHIIRVDDIRQAQLPKFEEVKPQIVQQLQQQRLQKYQEDLRAKAKVE